MLVIILAILFIVPAALVTVIGAPLAAVGIYISLLTGRARPSVSAYVDGRSARKRGLLGGGG